MRRRSERPDRSLLARRAAMDREVGPVPLCVYAGTVLGVSVALKAASVYARRVLGGRCGEAVKRASRRGRREIRVRKSRMGESGWSPVVVLFAACPRRLSQARLTL